MARLSADSRCRSTRVLVHTSRSWMDTDVMCRHRFIASSNPFTNIIIIQSVLFVCISSFAVANKSHGSCGNHTWKWVQRSSSIRCEVQSLCVFFRKKRIWPIYNTRVKRVQGSRHLKFTATLRECLLNDVFSEANGNAKILIRSYVTALFRWIVLGCFNLS